MNMTKRKKYMSRLLTLLLTVSMLPLSTITANAGTLSDNYKRLLGEYQIEVEQCTAQEAKDKAAMDAAQRAYDAAQATADQYKKAMDDAERTLNLKSMDYIEQKVIETAKKDRPDWDWEKNYYYKPSGIADYLYKYKDSTSTAAEAVRAIEAKYGEGALREQIIKAYGYSNIMTALDYIDECNEIRSDSAQLANYYKGVLGESTPSGIKPLRVSPQLMFVSPISAVLQNGGRLKHKFGEVTSGKFSGTWGQQGCGQNIAISPSPFVSWWYNENKYKDDSHNGNIADPNWTVCGFGWYQDTKACSQDFAWVNTSKFVSYSVEEYRNGLKNHCVSELRNYNNKVSAYEPKLQAANDAQTNLNEVTKVYKASARALEVAQIRYEQMEHAYQRALESEERDANKGGSSSGGSTAVTESYRIVRFYDSITDTCITYQKVPTGTDATAPAAPKHDGYTFKGWNASLQNIEHDTVIYTVYEKNKAGTTVTPPASQPTETTKPASTAPATPKMKYLKVSQTYGYVKVRKQSGVKYQFQIRKAGGKWIKSKTVKTAKHYTKFKKLKKNTKYYFRVRTYKTVNGKTRYSKWLNNDFKTRSSGTREYEW